MSSEITVYKGICPYRLIYSKSIIDDNFDVLNEDVLRLIDGFKKLHKKRMYYLFVESVQNTMKHGLICKEHNSFFYLFKNGKKQDYVVVTGNPIKKEEKGSITRKIDRINSLNKENIDKLYFQTLDNIYISDKGGAGLGFLHMKRKSNYGPLGYQIVEYPDCYYFYFIVEYKFS
jgi:hypothetical protein